MKPTTAILIALAIFAAGAITGSVWTSSGYEEDRQHTDRVLFEAAGFRAVKRCMAPLRPTGSLVSTLGLHDRFFDCLRGAVQQADEASR